jgi:PncC family amidohydrolase
MPGLNELYALAARIGALLKDKRQTVAVAESSAGGLVSASLLSVPGASAYYQGGGVVYTRKARDLLMAIPDADAKGYRSSSEPYALLLARTARSRFGATWAVSETGIAGPTGSPNGAPGHSCIAVAGADGSEVARTIETASDDRAANMAAFAQAALNLLLEQAQR